MSITRCRHLAVLILCGCLPAFPPVYGSTAETAKPSPPAAQLEPPSDVTYPQIVRISYMEGDVRIARGQRGATWETAVTGLPLEAGYNLVTGAGRAEIEFEDASTVYLGEHSALTFNDLRSTGGVPYTKVALLAGTLTLHIHAIIAGELFYLDTPARRIVVPYPNQYFERVNSYLDGMTVTPLKSSDSQQPETAEGLSRKQQTTIYSPLERVTEAENHPEAFADFDNWVENRVAERSDAMDAMMKASGLTSPIPGLADMNGQGTFFPCAPYGTCWAPTGPPGQQSGAQPHESPQVSAPRSQPSGPIARTTSPTPIAPINSFFPCPPTGVRTVLARDPGRPNVAYSVMNSTAAPYDWAVCHAGSWIYQQHGYAWVAGNRRHHHCPVHWVKTGRSVAFVPIHPRDVAGKPPINRVHGLYEISGRHSHSAELVHLDPGRELKILDTPPKAFRSVHGPTLSRAASPQLQAHWLRDAVSARKSADISQAATRFTFDQRSQSFTLDKHGPSGLKGSPERAVFNSRISSVQVRAGAVDAHGNYSTHGSGGSGAEFSGGRTEEAVLTLGAAAPAAVEVPTVAGSSGGGGGSSGGFGGGGHR